MEKANREGYNLTEEELREVQLIELEMLIEVDRICKNMELNIVYLLVLS